MNSYEILKFLTVKLTAKKFGDTNGKTVSATGFYAILDGKPVIVTAKHFTEAIEPQVTIPAHYKINNTIITVPVTAYVEWEASDEFDIAYCKIKPFEKKFKEITGHNMFYTAISEKNIMTKEEFSKLNILTEMLTMGYPVGASSTHHEYPLFKKGYIASMPNNFTEDGEGYLDMTCDRGMSGSPLLLNNSPLKLVGILVEYIKDDTNTTPGTTVYVSADKLLGIKNP